MPSYVTILFLQPDPGHENIRIGREAFIRDLASTDVVSARIELAAVLREYNEVISAKIGSAIIEAKLASLNDQASVDNIIATYKNEEETATNANAKAEAATRLATELKIWPDLVEVATELIPKEEPIEEEKPIEEEITP
jgi:hypothetical protein